MIEAPLLCIFEKATTKNLKIHNENTMYSIKDFATATQAHDISIQSTPEDSIECLRNKLIEYVTQNIQFVNGVIHGAAQCGAKTGECMLFIPIIDTYGEEIEEAMHHIRKGLYNVILEHIQKQGFNTKVKHSFGNYILQISWDEPKNRSTNFPNQIDKEKIYSYFEGTPLQKPQQVIAVTIIFCEFCGKVMKEDEGYYCEQPLCPVKNACNECMGTVFDGFRESRYCKKCLKEKV